MRKLFLILLFLPSLVIAQNQSSEVITIRGQVPNVKASDYQLTIDDNATYSPLNITERNTPPTLPQINDIYMDDGTNTTSGDPGFRRYTGAVWEDIGGGVNYWQRIGTTLSPATPGDDISTSGDIYATTFDTNVIAAGVTLAGTTLQADGTDANIDIFVLPKATGTISVTGTTDYETNITDDDDIPNKKYVDDTIGLSTYWDRTGTVLSPETIGDAIELDNETWLQGVDNAGTGTVSMFKVNTSDQIETGADLLTGPIQIGSSYISSDGDNEGISIDSAGVVSTTGHTNTAGKIEHVIDLNAATYTALVTDENISVRYTATGAVTDLELPTTLCDDVTDFGRVYTIIDTGNNSGANNISIKDTADTLLFTIATNGTAYTLICLYDGANYVWRIK